MIERIYLAVPAQVIVGNFIKTFAEFPMRQKPAKSNLDDVMKLMSEGQAEQLIHSLPPGGDLTVGRIGNTANPSYAFRPR